LTPLLVEQVLHPASTQVRSLVPGDQTGSLVGATNLLTAIGV
jgi:hypothetical protein